MQAALFGLGPLELIIIVAVVILIFVPTLLPKLVRRFMESVNVIKEMAGQEDEESGGDEGKQD
mgnify:CR=1 FL=1